MSDDTFVYLSIYLSHYLPTPILWISLPPDHTHAHTHTQYHTQTGSNISYWFLLLTFRRPRGDGCEDDSSSTGHIPGDGVDETARGRKGETDEHGHAVLSTRYWVLTILHWCGCDDADDCRVEWMELKCALCLFAINLTVCTTCLLSDHVESKTCTETAPLNLLFFYRLCRMGQ